MTKNIKAGKNPSGKKLLSGEKVLSFSAILISIMTLLVFLYQTNLVRQQQFMSVYPYLSLGNFYVNSENYEYVLKNDGIGPALIKSVKVTDKTGKSYNDIVDFLNAKLKKSDSVRFFYANLFPGRLVPEKEKLVLVGLNNGDKRKSKILFRILNREGLVVNIEYASIYGEVWSISNIENAPTSQ